MLNVCCFEGVLGKDARWIASGDKEFLAFTLGVSQGKNKDGTWRDTIWINCTSSVVSEKIVPYLGAKQKVSVVGALKPIRISQGKDGQQYHSLELSVFQIHLLGGAGDEGIKPSASPAGQGKPVPGSANNRPALSSEDIEF